MRQLTIRKVSRELAAALDELSERTGQSVNTIVLDVLEEALGTRGRRARLQRSADWSAAEARDFEKALRSQRQVDE